MYIVYVVKMWGMGTKLLYSLLSVYCRHKYGLAGAVMTRDLGQAIYVSNALRAGTVRYY